MNRNRNTNVHGGSFPESTVRDVWLKGQADSRYQDYRADMCGKWMKWQDYGDTNSQYGWEIDHIKPVSRDGTDNLGNLQPLQWENNRDKSDQYPWSCR